MSVPKAKIHSVHDGLPHLPDAVNSPVPRNGRKIVQLEGSRQVSGKWITTERPFTLSEILSIRARTEAGDRDLQGENAGSKEAKRRFGSSYGSSLDGWLDAVKRFTPSKLYWESYEEAKQHVEAVAPAKNPMPSRRRKPRRSTVPSGEIDVGLLYAGRPDYWIERKRTSSVRMVTLSWAAAHHWGKREDAFVQKIASVAALTDYLSASGYAVRLMPYVQSQSESWVCGTPDGPVTCGGVAIPLVVKSEREPLDHAKLLLSGGPAVLRYHGFHLYEWITKPGGHAATSYGYAHDPPDWFRRHEGVDVWLEGEGGSGDLKTSLQQGINAVLAWLKRFGATP
jgi:hypothetical protein